MTTSVVTGGAGFLGSHLCEYLLDKGHRVICLDNLDTGTLENIEHIRDDGFEFRNVDVIEHIDIEETRRLRLPPRQPRQPDRLQRACRCTHSRSARTARTTRWVWPSSSARASVISSTSEVYGDPLEHPQKETYWGNVNPIGPRGVYDEAKRYAEALTMAYHRQQGVDTCHRADLQHLRSAHARPTTAGRCRRSSTRH